MRRVICVVWLILSLWLIGAGRGIAQPCHFSASDLVFGQVNTLSAGDVDTSGIITIHCGGLLLGSVSVEISAGAGDGGSNGVFRRMTNGTSHLSFQLYRDAARTQVFGSTAGGFGGEPIKLFGGNLLLGQTETVPFYGRVFGGQGSASPGVYLSQFGPAHIMIKYRICTVLLLCQNRTSTFSFSVSATVEKECSVSATGVDFGTTGGLMSAIDATGRLDVLCTAGTDFQVGLDSGQNGSGPNERKMRSLAGGAVHYNLYRDAGRTAVWGDTSSADTLTATGVGATDAYSVYGRVPAQPTPRAGAYSDTVTVTLTY